MLMKDEFGVPECLVALLLGQGNMRRAVLL